VRRFQTPLPITPERATARESQRIALFSPWLSLMHFQVQRRDAYCTRPPAALGFGTKRRLPYRSKTLTTGVLAPRGPQAFKLPRTEVSVKFTVIEPCNAHGTLNQSFRSKTARPRL
jgi:hypothetical protein